MHECARIYLLALFRKKTKMSNRYNPLSHIINYIRSEDVSEEFAMFAKKKDNQVLSMVSYLEKFRSGDQVPAPAGRSEWNVMVKLTNGDEPILTTKLKEGKVTFVKS